MNPWRALFLLAALVALAPPISAQLTFIPDTTPQISVTGKGVAETQPDLATVTLGIYVLDPDLRQAKSASDDAVGRLLAVAEALGVARADISATGIDIGPNYSNADTPEFLGYAVSRSVTVTLRDLSRLDQLIDGAIQAGANREFRVDLKSSREKALREQAVAMAVDDARNQAGRLAEGFGVKLGRVRSVGQGSRQGGGSYTTGAVAYGGGTFKPGTIRVEAEVSVTYLLEP